MTQRRLPRLGWPWSTPSQTFAGSERDAGTGRPLRDRLMSLLVRPTAPPLWLGIVVAAVVIGVEALVVHQLRNIAPESTFGAVFLFGVLVVSAGWGLGLAVMTTLASAFVYVYFHIDTDGTYLPTRVEDLVAVLVFLPVAFLANILAGQARQRTAEADQRRREAEEGRKPPECLPTSRPLCVALRRLSRERCLPRRCSRLSLKSWPFAWGSNTRPSSATSQMVRPSWSPPTARACQDIWRSASGWRSGVTA